MVVNEVAVVFVHGIGTQAKSSTLSAWGEPLAAAFDRRVGNAYVDVEQAALALGDTPEVTLVVPGPRGRIQHIVGGNAHLHDRSLVG